MFTTKNSSYSCLQNKIKLKFLSKIKIELNCFLKKHTIEFDIANVIALKFGATSKWLARCPHELQDKNAIQIDMILKLKKIQLINDRLIKK
jgi:hypothetical protein